MRRPTARSTASDSRRASASKRKSSFDRASAYVSQPCFRISIPRGATPAACVASQSGILVSTLAFSPAVLRIFTRRSSRGERLPSASANGVRAALLRIARDQPPSRLPPAKANPTITRSAPSASDHSSGPRTVFTRKTTHADRFCARTGSNSCNWFLRTATRM